MSKYNIYTCNCGVIHAIETEKIDNALESDKDLLLICANCGNASLIGANRFDDDIEGECFMMYSIDFDKRSISERDFIDDKPIYEILYDKGIKIPMMTGNFANTYYSGKFYDYSFIDLSEIRNMEDIDNIHNYIDDLYTKIKTVNMNRLINTTDHEILEELSKYAIRSFKWRGTEFENEYNS